jgi:microcystin-dependent protein
MAPTYTTPSNKYGIPRIDGSSNVSDVDQGIRDAVDAVDARMAGYAEGTLSARAGITATAGKLYRTTDTGQVFMGTGSAWVEIGVSPWQPGDLKATWLTAAPAGWLLCDGAAVSRTTYAALFAEISTSAGPGDGSTTFNVPDYRGRVFVMPDGAAGRLSANDARGGGGGEEKHTLIQTELPTVVGTVDVRGSTGEGSVTGGATPLTTIFTPTTTTPVANGAGGSAHNNMQPFLVGGAVLIKT